MLLETGIFKDNIVTHLFAGLGAGFIAVCCGSPVDVVKSRVMGARARPDPAFQARFGVMDVVSHR
jgi:hypothetical protein